MVRIFASALLCVGLVLVGAEAGGTKLKTGDTAPAFAALPGVDGKDHSLGDYKKDVLVVTITCNHCPVAVAYEDRIIAFAKKYSGKSVDVVAINVNNLPADKLDKMKERAQEKGFTFAYLYDESQAIGRKLGAPVTPTFYVFDKSRKLVYSGAMDDNSNEASVTKNYLADAVDAALAGKTPATTSTRARGCGVKYERR